MNIPSADKLAFVLSLVVFAFLYGIATQAFGWFPSPFLQRAWNQAEAVSPLSTDLVTGDDVEPSWRGTRVYDRSGAEAVDPNGIQPGLTLLTSAWEFSDGWSAGLRLIDRDGDIVHEWQINPSELFSDTVYSPRGPLRIQDVQGTHLFPDGDVLVNVEYVGMARVDACGDVLWKRTTKSPHHSIARSGDGTFWVPGVERDRPPSSSRYPDGYPGLEGPIHHDVILEVEEDGEVLREIEVLDVLFDNGLERYIPHARLDRTEDRPYGTDITHLNDIEPLDDSLADEYPLFEPGDLAVSLRRQHLVFVFNPESGHVKWHAHRPFIHQHDPDFIGDGWIGVFDNNHDGTNRGTMLGGSRIVLLQPHTDSMRVAFPTSSSDPFYTHIRGKWQRLENGNLFLTEADAGRAVEVTSDGRTVWEWIHKPSGDATVPSVTKATRVGLSEDDVASWPCSNGSAAETGESGS